MKPSTWIQGYGEGFVLFVYAVLGTRSRQPEVIIDDATQYLAFLDEPFGQWLWSFNGGLLVKTLMRSALVVIDQELLQHPSQMSFIQDQHLVEALLTKSSNHPLRESMGIGSTIGCANNVDAFRLENVIK